MKKLGFGCMRLPIIDGDYSKINYEEFSKMIDHYLEEGFTYFDTAYMYHEYQSEIAVRECLVKRHDRKEFQLADKLPLFNIKEQNDVDRIFNEQLEKTGVEYFDYYLMHCVTKNTYETAKKFHTFEYAMEKKKEGKIKKLGFSFHDTAEFLDQVLNEHPEVEFVQLQLNYIDWESPDVQSRLCYEVARKHGKDIIVMETIKGGKLASLPEKAEKMMKEYNKDASVASWAVRYDASLDGVILCLSGMSNLEQLIDNTSYMKEFVSLNKEEQDIIQDVVKIINSYVSIPCTHCNYCVESCPKHIAIPDYFALYNGLKQLTRGERYFKNEYEKLTLEHGKASECIKCGMCEKHCPQKIKIREQLVTIKDTFEK